MNRRGFGRRVLSAALTLLIAPSLTRANDDEDKERARRRIGITRDQQKKIEELYRWTDEENRKVRERLERMHRDRDRLFESYDYDRSRVGAIGKEIAYLHQRAVWLHANSEEKLRQILTREQFSRLREHLKKERQRRKDRDDDDDRRR